MHGVFDDACMRGEAYRGCRFVGDLRLLGRGSEGGEFIVHETALVTSTQGIFSVALVEGVRVEGMYAL